MTVTERLMAPGQWSLVLRPDTPISVRNKIVEFGHIIITSAWLDPTAITDADLKNAARYTGIVRRTRWTTNGQHEISGPGLAAWLGDENGKGRVFVASTAYTAGTLSTWVAALIAPMLTVGAVTNTGTNVTWDAKYQTPRSALDYVCAVAGAEWRVNPNGKVDAAAPATLWQTTPNDVIMRRAGAGNVVLNGIEAGDLSTERDAATYVSAVTLLGPGEGAAVQTGSASVAAPYLDYFGNAVVIRQLVNAPSTNIAGSNLNAAASEQLARNQSVLPQLSITSDVYDVGRYVRPGDNVYIYDPDVGLFDSAATPVELREGIAQPLTLRCYAFTWPIERGMGVYYRDKNGVATDLTDLVRWENGATVWEVGQPTPTVFPVAEGVAASYSPAGERAARVWPPTLVRAACSADVTLTTSAQAITGATVTVTTTMPNAVAHVVGTFDFDGSVIGFGAMAGELQLDGVNQAGQALLVPTVAERATVSQSWVVTVATPGSHTFRLMGTKTVNAGTAVAHQQHTALSVLILE